MASRNARNQRALSSPTQLLIHTQWWSNRAMHLRSRGPAGAKHLGLPHVRCTSFWPLSARHWEQTACLLSAVQYSAARLTDLPHVRQCLLRAGLGRPQVQHSAPSTNSTPSAGYSRQCASTVAGVTNPGSARLAVTKRAKQPAAAAVPVALRRGGAGQWGWCKLARCPKR